MNTLHNVKWQDVKTNSIPPSASAKTGQFPNSHHNFQSHRQYYDIPVKFYNPARKTGSSSGGSFIDSTCSPPQPPVARSKGPSSSLAEPDAITLNAYHSQVEKAARSKGALDVVYQKKFESDTPESVPGDTKRANETFLPRPFRASDIQDGVTEPDANVRVEVATAASPARNVVAEDEKGKYMFVKLVLYQIRCITALGWSTFQMVL